LPPRTNEFQEIASLIEQVLAPKGAKVTTSAMVDVSGLEPTEVDVLIEGDFGPYRMKVAVEAKDEKRKLNIIDFRSYLAKYRGECRVQTDKFVIVTRNGFTEQVKTAAKKADVDLLTLDEAKEPGYWTKHGPSLLRFSFPVHVCHIWTEPAIGLDSKTLKAKARLLCAHCGRDRYGLLDFANQMVFYNCLPKNPELVKQLQEIAEKSSAGQSYCELNAPLTGYVLSVDGNTHPISKIRVQLHLVLTTQPLKKRTFARCTTDGRQQLFDHLEMKFGDNTVTMLMASEPKPENIFLRIDTPESRRKLRKQRNKQQKKKANAKKRLRPFAHRPVNVFCIGDHA
jgi:hypothetical protein